MQLPSDPYGDIIGKHTATSATTFSLKKNK